MWIRSQNRKILTNVNEVLICAMDDNKYFIEGFWDRGSDTLGIYSSEEKAMRVLDEIQKFISDKQYCAIDNVTCKSYILNKGVRVFEMPKDEDVEV